MRHTGVFTLTVCFSCAELVTAHPVGVAVGGALCLVCTELPAGGRCHIENGFLPRMNSGVVAVVSRNTVVFLACSEVYCSLSTAKDPGRAVSCELLLGSSIDSTEWLNVTATRLLHVCYLLCDRY